MDALFVLVLFALVVQGVAYWFYNTFRNFCFDNARMFVPHSTAKLFALTFGGGILFGSVVVAAIVTLSCFACPFYLAAIFYGISGWIEMSKELKIDQEERRKVLAKFPVSKLQFRILDLSVAAFTFGLILTILTNFVFNHWRTNPNFESATAIATTVVGILAMESCAFFIAMDVFRRSVALQNALPRMCYLVVILLLGVVPPIFPILILSWHVWRYSVWKVQVYW